MNAFFGSRFDNSTSGILQMVSKYRQTYNQKRLPFGPLPSKLEVAQMMGEPVHESV